MKLSIYTTATTGYTYALEAQARKVIANIRSDQRLQSAAILIMIVTDKARDKMVMAAVKTYKDALPLARVEVVANPKFGTGYENYKTEAQLLIAQMRTAATVRAIAFDSDYCWSLDCDVLPPPNAARCMIDMISFDAGYYGAAFCPYTSHSGGGFMGGRGTPQSPIAPDYYEDERQIPEKVAARRAELIVQLETVKPEKKPSIIKELQEIGKFVMNSCPPAGNVFSVMAKTMAEGKGWRIRGWMDQAYPAIGKGAIVPIDWSGFGCLMAGRAALALCDWTGYDGRGTEDLYINYVRWAANNIKIAGIPHCPCDHIVRKPGSPGKYVHVLTYHEDQGACVGHLRCRPVPWHPHAPGERSDPKNDGSLSHAPPKPVKGKRKAKTGWVPIKKKVSPQIVTKPVKAARKRPIAKATQ